MKDGKLGESFVTVFLKRLVYVLVEPFSEMLWERKTLLLVCPKLLSQEDGLKEGQKLFRVVVTLFISSVVKFCCTEPSTRAEWPSAAVTPSFGSWALGLILCLNSLFRRVRTGTETRLLAHVCAYEIRPRGIHVTVLKHCDAECGIFQQGDTEVLYASDACCIFKKIVTYLSISVQHFFFTKLQKWPQKWLCSFLFSFFPEGDIFTWARKIGNSK